jgi:alpha-ketoglutarate-dependent taurine dioxygenase
MIADKFAQTREVLTSDWPFDLTATAEVPSIKVVYATNLPSTGGTTKCLAIAVGRGASRP